MKGIQQRLGKEFFLERNVVAASRKLLGKFLVSNIGGLTSAGMIVETEAYRGPDDKASHAYNHRYTNRTKVMYEEGGVAYVYLCYGIHHLFNVVTGYEGDAHAVLIRAIEPTDNIEVMLDRRNMDRLQPRLTAGPGTLTKALGITTQYTGTSLVDNKSPLWIEDRGMNFAAEDIVASPRVGVDYAEECAAWPWRFRVNNSRWTSRAK